MRNESKTVFRIRLKFAFATEQLLAGAQLKQVMALYL